MAVGINVRLPYRMALEHGADIVRMMNYLRYLLMVFFTVGMLSACGGGGGGDGGSLVLSPEPDAVQNVVLGINSPHTVTTTIDGNVVTLTIDASYFQKNTVSLSDRDSERSELSFVATYPDSFPVTTIDGNTVALAGMRFTVTVMQTLLFTPVTIATVSVATGGDYNFSGTATLSTLNIMMTIGLTLTDATLTTRVTLTQATLTTQVTLTQATMTVTMTNIQTSFADVTAIAGLPSTLTVGAGFTPPVATISVSVIGVTQTATVAMVTNVLMTGVVTIGTKTGRSQLMFWGADGEWRPLSDDMRAQLIALGITLPTVTVAIGDMPITVAGSLSAYILTVETTITTAVNQTVFQTLTQMLTTNATLAVSQTLLVTASSLSIFLTVTTVNTTVSTLTVYAAYVSLSVVTSTVSVSNITVRAGATVAYDSGGSLSYVILPPPSSTTAINYRTTEFNRQYGLNQIGADHAYQRGYFGQGVTVGIVDTGMLTTHTDLTANLVPGRRSDASGNLHTDVNDADGHGTAVGGVVGAAMNGSGMHGVAPSVSLMPLQFGDSNGILNGNSSSLFVYAATTGVQILNNSWGRYDEILAGEYVANSVTTTIAFGMPIIAPLIDSGGTKYNNLVNGAYVRYQSIFMDKDMAVVWAAGNSYWHSGAAITYCAINDIDSSESECNGSLGTYTPEQLISNFTALQLTLNPNTSDAFQSYAFGPLSSLSGIAPNSPGDYSLAPLYQRSLLGKWVSAIAVDSTNGIAYFSNGCGVAKYWCLAAPGVDISTTYNTNNSATAAPSGTSFSAPHVAGALAVLKSRLSHMPMEVVLAILFTTATDLGAAGLDDVYGHGLINLEKAITVQGSVRLVIPSSGSTTSTGNNALLQSGLRLPLALQGLHEQLADVSVAVEYLDGFYYNMPLAALVNKTESKLPALGNAADDMLLGAATTAMGYGFSILQDADNGMLLHAVHENDWWRLNYDFCADCVSSVWEEYESTAFAKPFFAADKQGASFAGKWGKRWEVFAAVGLDDDDTMTYEQYGLRWHNVQSDWGLLSEFSHTDEEGALLGGKYDGAFAVGGAQTYQGRFRAERALGESWLGFADYQFGWSEADTASGSIIEEVSSLRFDGWRIGAEGRSLFGMPFAAEGLMKIGVTRHPRIRSGNVRLRYGVSGDESVLIEDYQYDLLDGYNTVNSNLSLSGASVTTYQWGYSFAPQDGVQAAFGLEYTKNAQEKNAAASIRINWLF